MFYKLKAFLKSEKTLIVSYTILALVLGLAIYNILSQPNVDTDDDDVDVIINNSFSLLNQNTGEKTGLFNK